MKTFVGFCLCALLAVPPVLAQVEVTDGIYLSTPAGDRCTNAEFLEHITVQLIAACPSHTSIWALEGGVAWEGGTNTALTITWSNACLTDPSPPDVDFFPLLGSFCPPLATSAQTVLGVIDIFYLEPPNSPLYFHLVGARPSSIGVDLPAYLADELFGPVLPLTPLPTGSSYDFAINPVECLATQPVTFTCLPVADTKLTWGAVKSLYR